MTQDEAQAKCQANHPIFGEQLDIIVVRVNRVGLDVSRAKLPRVVLISGGAGAQRDATGSGL